METEGGTVRQPPPGLIPAGRTAEVLSHNAANAATGGIWRVRGHGPPAIVKVLSPGGPLRDGGAAQWATSDEPSHWNYWRREEQAYRSGLADTCFAAGGIRAPRLLDATELPDGSVALWLEDVTGVPGPRLGPDQLGEFAYGLGVAQAAWIGRLPSDGWLSRDWLRSYTMARTIADDLPWHHPVAVNAWPSALRADLERLWRHRHEVLALTDRLPQTLCHHDVWPMNLVVDAAGPVLFDWAFVGPGPVGEDAANLLLDTFFDGLVSADAIDDVATAVIDGYSRGLAEVLSPAQVRSAIAVTGAAKYWWLAPRMLTLLDGPALPSSYDQRGQAAMFEGRRRPLELLASWSRMIDSIIRSDE